MGGRNSRRRAGCIQSQRRAKIETRPEMGQTGIHLGLVQALVSRRTLRVWSLRVPTVTQSLLLPGTRIRTRD